MTSPTLDEWHAAFYAHGIELVVFQWRPHQEDSRRGIITRATYLMHGQPFHVAYVWDAIAYSNGPYAIRAATDEEVARFLITEERALERFGVRVKDADGAALFMKSKAHGWVRSRL